MPHSASLLLVLVTAISAAPVGVLAGVMGPSSAEVARASELSANGGKLYAEGSYDAAIAAYTAAWDLVEDPNLLYNIALCEEKLGDFSGAADTLDRYRALAPETERADLVARAGALRESARQAEAQRLAADEQAAEEAKQREAAAAAATAEAEAQARADEAARVAEAERMAAAAEAERKAALERKRARRQFTAIAAGLGGLTGTGAVVGAVFGGLSLGNSRDAEAMCVGDPSAPLCPASVAEPIDVARRQALVADVSFAVAGAAAIGLVVHVAVGARRNKADKGPSLSLTPGPGHAGLGLRARF